MTSTTATAPPPALMRLSPDNWKLAILVGLIVSVIAAIALPASASFWIIGAMAAMIGDPSLAVALYAAPKHPPV